MSRIGSRVEVVSAPIGSAGLPPTSPVDDRALAGSGSDELARFRTFSAWYVAVSVVFGAAFVALGVARDHDATAITGLAILLAATTGLAGRIVAGQGHLRGGVTTLLMGLIAASTIAALQQLLPTLPAEAVIPFFALSTSLAYLGDEGLRRGIVAFASWVVLLAVAEVLTPARGSMPFGAFIGATSYLAATGILLLSFVQARDRLVRSARSVATAESRSEKMIAASLDAIVTADRDGRITAWSPQATRTLGWDADEVIGLPVADTIVPSDLREAHTEGWKRYVETGEGRVIGRRVELAALHRDGSLVPVELTIVDLGDRGEQGFGAFIHDLTERKAIADERRVLTSRLVEAIELERSRISSDIHDGPVQRLTAAILRLGNVGIQTDDPAIREGIERVDETMQASVKSLRRLMFDLYPHSLRERGLVAALRESLDHLTNDAGIQTELHARDDLTDLDASVAAVAYRIAQEVLVNARKHAHARRVDVLVRRTGDHLHLKIGDDGDGFDLVSALADPEHRGLRAIKERAELASGRLEIDSHSGVGTFVDVWIPLPA